MSNLIKGIEFLGIPMTIAVTLVFVFLIIQVVGELLEFKGKVVPEFIKIRKFFKRKKEEKEETSKMLKEVKELLEHVHNHYSEDNITKRDEWMQWVNSRADTYDKFITDMGNKFADVTNALQDNTKVTEEMFIQSSRDRIIDFATKVGDENAVVSREEFNRIFKVYDKYEQFLENRKLTNGEVAIAYRIITESYEYRMKHHSFIEDSRGYN
jgi:hypothetical protein